MSSNAHFPAREAQTQEQPGLEHEMEVKPSVVKRHYQPANKLKGKVAVITGGDSGIGRSVAYHFSLEGATVAFTYVDKEEKDAQETMEMLKESKHEDARDPIKICVDLAYDENCKQVIDKVVEAYGRVDCLCNIAGEQHTKAKIEEIEPEQLERLFRVNLFSMFYLVRHALPYMGEGSTIINTTSINAYKGNATLLDYTASKGAIVAFTRGLSQQLIERGIRVNGVAPGPVWTPLIPSTFPEEKTEKFGGQVPMKRAGQPDEIAPSYVFLASDDSSYYAGQVLHPNGGVVVNA